MKSFENQSLVDMIAEDKKTLFQIFRKLIGRVICRVIGLLCVWLLTGTWIGLVFGLHIINTH